MANIIQNAVAQQQTAAARKKKPCSIADYIREMTPGIKAALPSVMSAERFSRIALTAVRNNPKLGECTPSSFLAAMMTAAQLGLEPNTPLGQAYLIPYYNSRTKAYETQFQIGYRGLIELANRSGQVSTIQAHTVYENDEFSYSYGLEPTLHHVPATANRGRPTHFYAMYRTKDGGYGYEVMTMQEMQEHRNRYSKATRSPWDTNFEEMAKKTVLKKVLKYAPLRSEFVRAVAADSTVRTEISADMLDTPPTYIEADIFPAEEPAEEPDATGQGTAAAPEQEGRQEVLHNVV